MRDGVVLWATVKGFPTGTPGTNASTRARHFFLHALFDVILWRGEDAGARIVVALPKKLTYQRHAARTTWFERAAGFSYLWVTEDGVEGASRLDTA